jgi:hypothetical protein
LFDPRKLLLSRDKKKKKKKKKRDSRESTFTHNCLFIFIHFGLTK